MRDKQLAGAARRRKCPAEKVVLGPDRQPCGRRPRARKAGEGKEQPGSVQVTGPQGPAPQMPREKGVSAGTEKGEVL